jgi:hypothetical protein
LLKTAVAEVAEATVAATPVAAGLAWLQQPQQWFGRGYSTSNSNRYCTEVAVGMQLQAKQHAAVFCWRQQQATMQQQA